MLLFRRAVLGYICGVSGSDDGAGADASCGVGGVSAVLLTSLGCWATVRPGELASDRGKLVFDKLRPQQLRYTIAVGCFWLGMVIHRFCDPSVCPAGSNPIRTRSTASCRNKRLTPTEGHSWGGLDSA